MSWRNWKYAASHVNWVSATTTVKSSNRILRRPRRKTPVFAASWLPARLAPRLHRRSQSVTIDREQPGRFLPKPRCFFLPGCEYSAACRDDLKRTESAKMPAVILSLLNRLRAVTCEFHLASV